ncbi:MAG: PQQ-binding-like beta-propeller repeat protein [Fuerstiella sp.]|nr:PQQ-binding-like beta-propeller repeat protein [Fuerstiella sp.]MCP4853595.1 PQQ-binding-like beta-propeller repeat protein [Fuerstiella sp.]
MKSFPLYLTTLLVIGAINAQADNWPSWRGPTSNGICLEKDLPTEWGPDQNVAWRIALPGPAGATPVVWDDQIFLTTIDGDSLLLMCFGTDGKEQWRQEVGRGNRNVRVDEGNSASPSPVTDGKHVWSLMGTGQLACFDLSGKPVWQVDLQKRYGDFDIAFGMSSTPVLHNGRLFLQLIHGDGRSDTHEALTAALDAETGKELWKSDRVTQASNENEHSYASPMLYNFGGVSFLITHGADYTIAHSLDDGKELWRLGGLNPHDDPSRRYHPTLRFVASPAAADGIIVCPTAKNGPVFAVRPDRSGDLTNSKEALLWSREKNTPDVPSPLIHGDLVYLCRENGMLLCLDRKTGEEVYHERTNNGRHRASPLLAHGHIYLTARDKGTITVIKTGREFKMVAQNETNEVMSSSPAVSDGTIYLRTFDALWAIREK